MSKCGIFIRCPKTAEAFGQFFLRPANLLFLAACLPALLPAQVDTTYALPVTTVRGERFERIGFAAWKADSLPAAAVLPLSERLFWQNPLSVRVNAPGALATVSARGLGPAHTPVFWQGVNLQSPQNGVVDAAMLPLWPGDRAEVRYGGQSAALSSGAMGGAVLVESPTPDPGTGWGGTVGAATGSFGAFQTRASLIRAGEAWQSETRAAWQQADNDFPYENFALIGSPQVRQSNNRVEKLDLQQFSRIAVGPKNVLRTAVWQQTAFREIPPAMTEAPAETWQRDRAFRAVASWERRSRPLGGWQHRLAWFDESIRFRLAGDTDSSRARTALFSTEYGALAGRWRWKAGASGALQWGQADGYADSMHWYGQHRAALFGMTARRLGGGQLSLMLRQEWLDRGPAPFTWSLGGEFGPLRFHVSRNFLFPTFNDRFWRTLGNSDLRSESGYSGDIGVVLRKKTALAGLFSLETTGFGALVDDWILWQPGSDGIFRPGNLKRVWSRGAETVLNWQQAFGATRLTARLGWQWTRTTNSAVYGAETASLHKQLPYVPVHAGSFLFHFTKGSLSGAYLHQWTGARFTTTDNSAALEGFHLGQLLLQYNWSLAREQALIFDFRLENCWNAAYQAIAYRAMPGRNWCGGITWTF